MPYVVLPGGTRHTILCHRRACPVFSAAFCTKYALSIQIPPALMSVWKNMAAPSSGQRDRTNWAAAVNHVLHWETLLEELLPCSSETSGREVMKQHPSKPGCSSSHEIASQQWTVLHSDDRASCCCCCCCCSTGSGDTTDVSSSIIPSK